MKKLTILTFLFLGILIFSQKVIIKISEGDIVVKLYPKKAPITVANFLKYIDEKRYDNTSFYRTVRLDNQQKSDIPIQVIQGGVGDDETKIHAPIPLERTKKTGLSHKVGAISMARGTPDSATTKFFICLGKDQPQLDFGGKRNPDGQGFAVFGKVVKGMEIVKKINQAETVIWEANNQKQWIKNPVKIYSIKRL
ncbi:MAG: peptidylprolyl isomerase [Cloacibacterium sp.]|nr:peptidylprolyl isomerase [Cloacibacterium sp.]